MTDGYFFDYMRSLLGERYDEFISAYRYKPRHKALRVNTKKLSTSEFKKLFDGELKQNPLCENSFYCDVKPSLDPLYHAGLYYMQEPSASAAVAAFAPFIGERVLDLCAAPGGKSTQVAEHMQGGVLFCNEPEFKRLLALEENLRRLGVDNAVVTRRTAADYSAAGFDGYFDTLIVDAPCSGGGMMRYEKVPYSENIVSGCAERQRAILADAVKLLRCGGYMLYSTCTFATEENEDNVNYLRSLGMRTVDIPLLNGQERGIGIADARRIYPMNFDGEGHFFCVLQKTDGTSSERKPLKKRVRVVQLGGLKLNAAESRFGAYTHTYLNADFPDCIELRPTSVGVPLLCDEKLQREAIYETDYALVHALKQSDIGVLGSVEACDDVMNYLRGGQLNISAPRGYVAVTYKGYALGLGYSAPSGDGSAVIKNGYPKKLRI